MSKLFNSRVLAVFSLALMWPCLAVSGSLPVPFWSTSSQISSDDGFADLHWAVGGRDPVAFFRLTEEHGGQSSVHFVDHPTTRLYRITPGRYTFRVQACERDPGGYPSCGDSSDDLVLTITEAVNSLKPGRSTGGTPSGQVRSPAGFTPGRWHNPDREGHGWSFFWKSRLSLPENDPLYGDAWDLLGLWYTYEARHRERACAICPWIYSDYRPVFARMALSRVNSNRYQGTVSIERNGQTANVGSMAVIFSQVSSQALVNWDANFLWQPVAGSDDIELLVAPDANPVDNPAHYSGLWDASDGDGFQVAHALGFTSESVEVVFEDEDGHPGWILAAGDDPVPGHTDLCFFYVSQGFAPGTTGEISFYEHGCDADVPAHGGNRNGFRRFTDFESEELWVAFELPGGTAPDRFMAGTPNSPASLAKSAGFHRIEYQSSGGGGCHLTAGSPDCTVELTWFTDHDYPDASAFAHNSTTGERTWLRSAAVTQGYEWCVAEAGDWQFELRMGESPGSSLMALSDVFAVTGQNASACGQSAAETPPDPAPAPDMTPSAASSKAGATGGEFTVTPSGSASYRIPILAAPGSGGLAPSVALVYDSQGGNGPVGAGWGIDGFSVISRCGQTIEQDGAASNRRITFSAQDRFCLDGERLMAVEGVYGAHGTEYRKEREDFTRVVSYGSGSDGPQYFKAWTKQGALLEFGRTADSRIETRASGIESVAFAWAQNRLEDGAGNYVLFEYSERTFGPVDFVLDTIHYTGNSAAGTQPYAEIRFEYAGRSDDQLAWVSGVGIAHSRLLQSVDSLSRVAAGSPLEHLRTYRLAYGVDGWGRAALESLRECRDSSAAVCFEPTTFDWLKTEHEVSAAGPDVHALFTSDFRGLALGDVSGDGRADLLVTERDGQEFEFAVATGSSSGSFTLQSDRFQLPAGDDPAVPVALTVIDLNADGYQDVMFVRESAGEVRWHARLAGPSGLGSEFMVLGDCCGLLSPALLQVMDFNGDGLSDVMTHRPAREFQEASEIVVLVNDFQPGDAQPSFREPLVIDVNYPELFPTVTPTGWSLADEAPFFGFQNGRTLPGQVDDFYGDGSADILVRLSRRYERCPGMQVCRPDQVGEGSQGSNVFLIGDEDLFRAQPTNPLVEVGMATFYLVFFADGNGDYSTYEIIARGAGDDCDVADVCNPYPGLAKAKRTQAADINADSLADVVYLDEQDQWRYRINSGSGFLGATLVGGPGDEERAGLGRFVDLTGDGYPEFIYPESLASDNARWMVQYNDLGLGFSSPSASAMPAGNTRQGDSSVLLDFTADGMVDQLFVDWRADGNGAQSGSTRLRKGRNRFTGGAGQAVNVIESIEDGFGSVVGITYGPLTDPLVHTRLSNSSSLDWGRGSAIYDLAVPVYAVSRVENSSPLFNDPNAAATRLYHYAGARIQAGGRGFLGFAEVVGFDAQTSLRTNTRYRQDFPFTGLVADSSLFLSNNSDSTDLITDILLDQAPEWPQVGAMTQLPPHQADGTLIRFTIHEWSYRETTPGSGSWSVVSNAEIARENSLQGHFKSKALVEREFDAFANIAYGEEGRFASDTTVAWSRITTTNEWLNQESQWRLGRLTASEVSHWRADGGPAIVRESAFEYDPQSGLLVEEIAEPGSSTHQVVTAYALDHFGNRISTSITGAGMAPRTGTASFDALGRFAVARANAYGQDTRVVTAWDVFGNALETFNIDQVQSTHAFDLMGRPFISYTETGAWSRTEFALGSRAQCPSGTAFHSISTAGGGGMQVSCFDRLQRQVRSAREGLLGGWVYNDSYFDPSGRPERVSEPYFAGQSRYWTVNQYDALGRIVRTTAANGLIQEMRYDLEAVHCGHNGARAMLQRTVTGTGPDQLRWQADNVAGEALKVVDHDCGVVNYGYDAVGNLVEVEGVDGAVIAIEYDSRGVHKVQLDDPDKGLWQYASNALGEVTRQLDSKQQAIDFEYDLLGRVTHRRELTGVSSLGDTTYSVENHEIREWQNGTGGGVTGRGQLVRAEYREGDSGAVMHARDYSYDGFGRPAQVDHALESEFFSESATYDAHGRVFQQFDASGGDRGVRFHYNARGYAEKLQEARDGEAGVVYQHILALDPRGNPTAMELGNGAELFATYDPASGYVATLEAYAAQGGQMQFVEYDFDRLGNLLSRHDHSGSNNLREDFTYDQLNRLERVLLTAPSLGLNQYQTQSMAYDASGNITWKSGLGAYAYGQGLAGPHAVTSAGGINYSYDANGNQVSSSDGRTIEYSVFDQATRIENGAAFTAFSYGVGNQRYKRVDDNAVDGVKTTWSVGSVELIDQAGQSPHYKRYIAGLAIVDYTPSSDASEARYLARDQLGSIHSISNGQGEKVAEHHFGPWGIRQGPDWQAPLGSSAVAAANAFTTRGFTGHEHADGVGIIHMGGRIYDPRLGRFLQADPFVQAPRNSQNLNRYSYVLNNPLSYTDPSGFFLKRLIKRWGRVIVAAVAAYFTFGAAYGAAASAISSGVSSSLVFAQFIGAVGWQAVAGVVAGAASGLVAGAILTGNLRGAVKSAFAGAITGGIASHYADTYSISRVFADSVAGGVSAEIYGESFKDGFLSAALTSFATFANVRMRERQLANSRRTPGQVAPGNPGYRGVGGGGAGERIFEDEWDLSGAAAHVRSGIMTAEEAVDALYLPYLKSVRKLSPLGCFQGSNEQCIFGWRFDPNGNALERFANYVLEGYAGPHDTLNSWYFYNEVGMNKNLTGLQWFFGKILNPVNVALVTPIVVPSLVPDYMRHLHYAAQDR